MHFSATVIHELNQKIMNILQVYECDHSGSYIGLPFCKGKSQREAFQGFVEEIANRLAGWKGKLLS